MAGGVALFAGILVLQATLAFWTVDSLEIMNVLTYGGVQAAQYPLNIYAAWFRQRADLRPAAGLRGLLSGAGDPEGGPDPLGAPDWLLPLATDRRGFAFLALSFLAWRAGHGAATSTGQLSDSPPVGSPSPIVGVWSENRGAVPGRRRTRWPLPITTQLRAVHYRERRSLLRRATSAGAIVGLDVYVNALLVVHTLDLDDRFARRRFSIR